MRYQPFYCEENAWWLCQHERLQGLERWVVFISNQQRACPLLQQRAVPPGEIVLWDYHVIVMSRADSSSKALVWDLDSRLHFPVDCSLYLDVTFAGVDRLPARFAPKFRVVPAPTFIATFSTDRSHMRDSEGNWLQPPPPWNPPQAVGVATHLSDFIDMQAAGVGTVATLQELRTKFDAMGAS